MDGLQPTARAETAQKELRVIKHAENGATGIEVFVHFGPVMFPEGQNEAVVTAEDQAEYIRFAFTGEGSARVRIEIRSEGRIVYREEGQIEDGRTRYETRDHRFKV
jgi:hypothetical protein